MLIVKVFVNKRQIDELMIQNMGYAEGGMRLYEVIKPDTEEYESPVIVAHERSTGWKLLVRNVLGRLIGREK